MPLWAGQSSDHGRDTVVWSHSLTVSPVFGLGCWDGEGEGGGHVHVCLFQSLMQFSQTSSVAVLTPIYYESIQSQFGQQREGVEGVRGQSV